VKSKSEYLIRCRVAKVCVFALAALGANIRLEISEDRTAQPVTNLKHRANLAADEHDNPARRASGEQRPALAAAWA
jgi:hypothetical protein